MFSMASFLSGFSIGAIFGGIKPILGSLSSVVSGDASMIITRVGILDLFFFFFLNFYLKTQF